ncbi:MAG: GlxA family transcriptional regulator, partial [Marinobacter sp.]
MFNVAIVAFPNCHASGVHGIMDFFTVANFCGRAPAGRSEPLFNCQVVTVDDRPVRGYSGAVVTPTCKRGDFEPGL